jgi:hypothetical protein
MTPDTITILLRGLIGTSSSGVALAASVNPEVKYWLQVSSLGVGILVGLLTAISLVKSIRRK